MWKKGTVEVIFNFTLESEPQRFDLEEGNPSRWKREGTLRDGIDFGGIFVLVHLKII